MHGHTSVALPQHHPTVALDACRALHTSFFHIHLITALHKAITTTTTVQYSASLTEWCTQHTPHAHEPNKQSMQELVAHAGQLLLYIQAGIHYRFGECQWPSRIIAGPAVQPCTRNFMTLILSPSPVPRRVPASHKLPQKKPSCGRRRRHKTRGRPQSPAEHCVTCGRPIQSGDGVLVCNRAPPMRGAACLDHRDL